MSQPKRKKGPMSVAQPGRSECKKGSDFQQQCLSNSVVLRTIFSELPPSDLLSCRLVNKCWFSEVNSVMLTSDIDLRISSDQPLQQVEELIERIPHMTLPFNGLCFKKDASQSSACKTPKITDDLALKFLRVLPPIKHLHFDGSLDSKELVIKMMFGNYFNLEKVSFDNSVILPKEILEATHELVNLKTIAPKKSSQFPEFPYHIGNVRTIIEGCKSIEVVEDFTFGDIWETTKERRDLVKNLSLDNSSFWLPPKRYTNFLKAKPRLNSLTLVLNAYRMSPPIMSIIPDLVHLSKETLTLVDFSPYIWGLLARGLLHFEPLSHVRELYRVPVNLSRMTSDQIANFGRFIAYMFPNVKFIEVENLDFDEKGLGGSYDNVFANWSGNGTLANSSVTSLKFVECQQLQVSLSAAFLVAFPKVTNLNVSLLTGKLQSVYDLWGDGPDLQSLNISAQVKSRSEMESELLGIFPEEARRLRELKLSPAQLKTLQIVPIRPALHHLTGRKASESELTMPVKRGNGRRRGISQGPEKRVRRGRPVINDNVVERAAAVLKKRTSASLAVAKLAKRVFNAVAYFTCNLHLIPMKHENGAFSVITAKLHKLVHYSLMLLLFARVANLVYVCSWLIFEEFSTKNLLSFTWLLLYLFSATCGICSILMSRETVQVINAWRQVLGILEEARGVPVDMYKDISLSIKVIGAGGPGVLGPLAVCALPMVYPEIPVSVAYQMKEMHPEMSDMLAQIIGFVLEYITSTIAASVASFGVCVLVISTGLLNVVGKCMRKLSLNTAAHRQQMTCMFLFFKVYNAILNAWYRLVAPGAHFGWTVITVVALYITIRHTELQTVIYCFYPYLSAVVLVEHFGICYDIVVGINASEETIGRLRSRHAGCFRQMAKEEKAVALRLAKAMRPVVLSVGSFTDFNIGVPLGMWDEILNQLVFLLTL